MKRFVCILFVILFLPVVALADSPDPIVGCWYMYYDKSVAPEMETAFPDADIAVTLYFFNESGIIYAINSQASGAYGSAEYASSGKWVKNDYGYTVSIIGFGECTSYLQDDSLLLQIPNASAYSGSSACSTSQ